MKILTISNYYPSHPGGIEIVAQNLVSRWRTRHQVRWAASAITSHPYEYQADDVPLPANNFAENHLGFPYPVPSLSAIFEIFKQVQWCDIVHIHDCLYFSNLTAFIASRLYSKPIITTQHIGMVPYQETYKNVLQKIAYQTTGRLVLKHSDEVVFINNAIKNWFETKIPLKKTSLIQNGVDHRIFFPANHEEKRSGRLKLGLDENSIVLLFIGRFTQKKGVDLIQKIATARPEYQWLILGGGEIDISKWNLPNVKIYPRQPQKELREFYIVADMFVLPSTGEGFPLAVQEALSCGVPAAVSDEIALSLPDAPLISLNVSSMPNLLAALDSSLEKTDYLNSLRARAQDYVKIWDWGVISSQYEEHFARLTDKAILPKAHL